MNILKKLFLLLLKGLPSDCVGCLLVKNNRIISQGYNGHLFANVGIYYKK